MIKKIRAATLFTIMLSFAGVYSSSAQSMKAERMFKKHINRVVQKVKNVKNPEVKRKILNASFSRLHKALAKAEKMDMLSDKKRIALAQFKQDITNKRNELNGLDGFKKISDSQLNNFADFVQQDVEQANLFLILGIVALVILLLPSIILGIHI